MLTEVLSTTNKPNLWCELVVLCKQKKLNHAVQCCVGYSFNFTRLVHESPLGREKGRHSLRKEDLEDLPS